ncbi:hypothetical protein TWF102_011378 [Orbilia oligospora]|uniref:Uncharacterized protein n=1 Tax=Orbilia oligospora TaxID=2813651 RepID=A0A7C8NF06_ORBOL|nr:hypothetical protein TWF103_011377 [Orbilia oligospora]KAF3107889.1 hypothetical protein TWF102_011378 [Orbilia oligospora]
MRCDALPTHLRMSIFHELMLMRCEQVDGGAERKTGMRWRKRKFSAGYGLCNKPHSTRKERKKRRANLFSGDLNAEHCARSLTCSCSCQKLAGPVRISYLP